MMSSPRWYEIGTASMSAYHAMLASLGSEDLSDERPRACGWRMKDLDREVLWGR